MRRNHRGIGRLRDRSHRAAMTGKIFHLGRRRAGVGGHRDGAEFDARPGEVTSLPSGHDAYVVGDEPVVLVDFQGMIDYAKSL